MEQDIPASYICERMCNSTFAIMVDNLGDGCDESAVDHVGDAFDTVAMVIDYWDPSALIVD